MSNQNKPSEYYQKASFALKITRYCVLLLFITFIIIPIIVIPNIHIINKYDVFVMILFLNAWTLFNVLLLIFVMNVVIFSNTSFWSFKLITLEKIAPDITPKNRMIIIVKFIFLLGNIIFLILLYLFIISSPS